jgi:hypothetical protein
MTIQAVSIQNRVMEPGLFHGLLMAIIAKGRDLIHQPEARVLIPGMSGTTCLMAIVTGVFGGIMQVFKFQQITMAFHASRWLCTYHSLLKA